MVYERKLPTAVTEWHGGAYPITGTTSRPGGYSHRKKGIHMKKMLMACVIVLCSVAMAAAQQGPRGQGARGQGQGARGEGQGARGQGQGARGEGQGARGQVGTPGGGMGFVGGFGGGMGGIGAILRDADLRKELEITEEQVTRFQEESQKLGQAMRDAMPQIAGRGLGGTGAVQIPQLSEADREAMQKVRSEFTANSRKMMEDVFSKATVEKLDTALFQFAHAGRGLPTVDDFVSLKLTDEQKKKFEETARAFQTAMRELPRTAAGAGTPGAGGLGGFQTSEAYVALVKEYKEKQTTILTDAQKEQAKKLVEATSEKIKTLATNPMGVNRQPGAGGARQPGRQNLNAPADGTGGGFRRASRTTET